MKRLTPVLLALLALVVAPGGAAVTASPTLRAALVHTLRGCHVFAIGGKEAPGPAARVTVARGTRLLLRVSCPMDFELTRIRGPRLAFGPARLQAGTTRAIVFRQPGVYRLQARNLQSAEQVGLATLGPDNTPTLVVVVR